MIELMTIDQGENKGTISALLVDGVVCCFTLELPWLNNQPNISCIPAGEYNIQLEYSPKFDRILYEVKNVPNRSEIKFHVANYQSEIQGCIAPGTYPRKEPDGKYSVGSSTDAFNRFMTMMNHRQEDTLHVYHRPDFS